jgi:predicted acyltransferase (DUF342 family)
MYTVLGSDPLEELAVPDGTHVQEHDLVTDGDVLVGGQSVVELGVRGGTVIAGERVRFGGDIEADGDCRLDMWCEVDGNVLVGNNAYLGERVHITGQLIVSGDLDAGDDVDIEEGFEANGWIVIRNPMPTIVFLFVYLSQLLRIGEEEAAEEVADEFLTEEREADPVLIPRGARVSDDAWRVSTPASIGDDCRLHGNIRATSIEVGTDTEVFGSLRAKGDIRVGEGTVVHGDVTTKGGNVVIEPGASVRGDISCEDCELSEAADVDGAIRARGEMSFKKAPAADAEQSAESEAEPPEGDAEEAATEEETADGDGFEWAQPEESETADSASEPADDADPTPAIVPLGEGTLPEPDPTAAIVPAEESDLDWESVGDGRTPGNAKNGTQDSDADDDGISGVIAEAEDA